MALALEKPIADYFEADGAGDVETVARCFSAGAVVKDEGQIYSGHAAIRRWKSVASAKFAYTVDPIRMDADAGRIVVTGRVAGDFPGSPTDLRYVFVLAGEKISALEIAL